MELYIDSTVENPSILTYNHHVGRTSQFGEVHEASPDDSNSKVVAPRTVTRAGRIPKGTHAMLIYVEFL